ncbi:MAG TPA: hypothetical protein VNV25_06410 [Gemmatimonadaceae bacterium]|jgi:hypothetical protein|nr:hypothetical protein [Gemmatimonadaceae bacterium]
MIRRAIGLALAVIVCSAHVGSPDVYYEGNAGPYPVLVIVRLPGVVPGVAEVTVHVTGAAPDRVTLFVNRYDATTAAPPPEDAARSVGDSATFVGKLWVMAGGSNSVTVGVHGSKGTGTAVVPVVAVATRRLPLYRWLGVILGAIGIFLFVGAVSIGGAAVREATLEPGQVPDAAHRRHARLAMAGTGVFVAVMLFGGWTWWNATDAEFKQRMYRPFTVRASEAQPGQLTFAITDSAWLERHDSSYVNQRQRTQWSALIPDHGKLMHLFLVADSGFAFAHLHPATTDTDTFRATIPPLPKGRYRVFADIVHGSGFDHTLVTSIDLTDPPTAYVPSDSDDAFSVAAPGSVIRKLGSDTVAVGAPAGLRFVVSGIQPYMGMAGHAVVVRDDGSVFIHLHPMGTISTAAQMVLARGQPMSMSAMGDTVSFPYAFPKAGRYYVWVQVKRGGRVLTAPYVVVAQ